MADRDFAADLGELQRGLAAVGLYQAQPTGLWDGASFEGLRLAIAAYGGLQHLQATLVLQPAPTAEEAIYAPVVDARVALEVAYHEALVRQAYRDSGGTWTWSVGLTAATGHKVDRYIDRPQPLQHCMDVYVWALRRYSRQVVDVFRGHQITREAFAGAVSFHWNTGGIRSARWPKLYMSGDHKEAEASFREWNKSGGKVNAALTRRRADEADLIWRGLWRNDGTMTEIARLTGNHRPDWSSAIRVDVRAALERAFGTDAAPILDVAPQPVAVPDAPTLTIARDA